VSLKLRQACQPSLDTAGLTNMHVSINNNKYLEVVGECGKPLFTLTGIYFGTKTPKDTEIEYANTLLARFLAVNLSKITALIDATTLLNSTTQPALPKSISHKNYYGTAIGQTADGEAICNLTTDATMTYPRNTNIVIDYFNTKYKTDVQDFNTWHSANTQYMKLVTAVADAKQTLQSCGI